eukprot:235972-Alexandrium_andersonii.AAC.1
MSIAVQSQWHYGPAGARHRSETQCFVNVWRNPPSMRQLHVMCCLRVHVGLAHGVVWVLRSACCVMRLRSVFQPRARPGGRGHRLPGLA